MRIQHQRFALLTGVCVSVLALTDPAYAATNPGIDHQVTSANVDDTLTICLADDSCNYGVASSGSGLVTAVLKSVAAGEIRQVGTATGIGGNVVLDMSNGGAASFSALADASAAGGLASAFATISPAIVQSGAGSGDVTLELTNAGTLMINAAASASASHALAAASANGAIHQFANATGAGDASASIANSGELDIMVAAAAHGESGAAAIANVERGIGNYAAALGPGDAFAKITNSGDIAIAAGATAAVAGTAGTAYAEAFINDAIQQTVFAQSGLASGEISNSGSITIDARASASAVTTAPVAGSAAASALAFAVNSYAIDQTGSAASGDVSLAFSNSGSIDVSVEAKALAVVGGAGTVAGTAFASAYMHDPLYQDAYAPAGDIAIAATNDGTLDLSALAAATGYNAIAQAQVEYAISQFASGAGGTAQVAFTNGGRIDEMVKATANANGGLAFAMAELTSGLFQLASAAGDAGVKFANSGTLNVVAAARAHGATDAVGVAFLNSAVEQYAIASRAAAATMSNSGSIALDAAAHATADKGRATAIAFASHGISQHAFGGSEASITLDNSGTLDVLATATAKADGRAFGEAGIFRAIWQSAFASGAATADFVNSGTVMISANAHGVGTGDGNVGRAIAVVVPAIFQAASGSEGSLATINNSGKIDVRAIAHAIGGVGAPAIAQADGIAQYAADGTASFVNSGSLSVFASAHAHATGSSAFAGVRAQGVLQNGYGGKAIFHNSGDLAVEAVAQASGAGGSEDGTATGYYVRGDRATLDVDNSGKIDVAAIGKAPDLSLMHALGIRADAIGGSASSATQQALISGNIVNSGTLHVVASAAGGGPAVSVTSGGGHFTYWQSSASAIGISSYAGVDTSTITNKGKISVDAVTADGGRAVARGVLIQGNGTGLPAAPGDQFTFTNDGGTIIVRQSGDGGKTWQRGTAIDVSSAPNKSVINLVGQGTIYGDIALAAGDEINVRQGTTWFDGVINPSLEPAGGITGAALDSGLHGVGTLTIGDGGNLVLADPRLTGPANMYDGPAYALVDTLTVASDGTLTFELQPSAGGAQPVGSYPQVFADTANLGGKLVADITTANGLFADSYSWQNVIDANVRNGTFGQCVLGGPNAGSLLLKLACTYDSNANVDLALTRVAFGAVAGLNGNGVALGGGLECIYDVALTGGAQHLFHDLFLITDAAKYNVALNQLSGSVYANYLNSFPSLGVHYDDLTDHATNCDGLPLAGSVLECRGGSPVHVWGQLDYQTRKASGDIEAGSTRSKRFTGLLGVDADVG
ncbi:MAG TPA: hypothetical protein VLM36_11995, partial [Sphingomicrobium sp.]|nr:hypothetical protein [Sphingomicrobium sp.]